MTSLEWNDLASKFYSFKSEAEKHGFYVPELANMEGSLNIIRPYKDNKELHDKVSSGLVSRTQDMNNDIAAWTFAKCAPPRYDDNDNLVAAS